MGQTAVSLLLEYLGDRLEEPSSVSLPTTLTVRESS
jgi:DNA-binding LacI/PurR family transcriptional regulator